MTEGAPRLAGRQRELSMLTRFLDRARTGAGGVALVDGAAGTGKSRLIATAVAMSRMSGMTCLRAVGRHTERDLAYGVLIQLFAQQRDEDDGTRALAAAGPMRRLIEGLREDPRGVEADGLSTFHSMFCALRDFTVPEPGDLRPLTIVVDDVNGCDRPSIRLLAYVAQRSAHLPIALLVATRRGEPETDPHALTALRTAAGRTALRPGSLGPSVVDHVVRDAFPGADASVLRAFREATAGNPLLLAELLAEAQAVTGDAAVPPAKEEIADLLPAGVVTGIESQLCALPAGAADLLRAVAALGGTASLKVARAAARLDRGTASRCGDALAAAGLLAPGDPLEVAAPLLYRALRRSVPPLQRSEMSRRAAQASGAEQDADADDSMKAPELPHSGDRRRRSLSAAEMAMDSSTRDRPLARTQELAELAWRGLTSGQSAAIDAGPPSLVPLALMFADELERAQEILADRRYQQISLGAGETPAANGCCHAWTLYHQGNIAAALSVAQGARDTPARHDEPARRGLAYAIAACHIERDEVDEAEAELAISLPATAVSELDRLLLLDTRARLRLAQNRASDALGDALEAGRLSETAHGRFDGAVAWRSAAAQAHLGLDQRSSAESLVEAELALAHRRGSTRAVLRALRLQGLLAPSRRRLDLLAATVRFGAECPQRLEYLHGLVDYGTACRRANQRAAARGPLRAAIELCLPAGATALAQRAAEELAMAEGGSPAAHPTTLTALTPSERRVADLAAQGLTTRQIATELFVTPKTVEFHLRHVYRKLQIPSSRAELAATLRPSGQRRPVQSGR